MTGEASVSRVELFSASRRVTGMTPNEIEQYYWLEDDRVVKYIRELPCVDTPSVLCSYSVCIYSALKAFTFNYFQIEGWKYSQVYS